MTGPELRAWRRGRGWTVRQAAGWAGVPGLVRSQVRTWQRWEAGRYAVPALLAARIRSEVRRGEEAVQAIG